MGYRNAVTAVSGRRGLEASVLIVSLVDGDDIASLASWLSRLTASNPAKMCRGIRNRTFFPVFSHTIVSDRSRRFQKETYREEFLG